MPTADLGFYASVDFVWTVSAAACQTYVTSRTDEDADMTDLVTSEDQVIINVLTLLHYRSGNKVQRKFHDDLTKRGKLFVAIKSKNNYGFAPSRFAGYNSNSDMRHNRNEDEDIDGRRTNLALNEVLGPYLSEGSDGYAAIDKAFLTYCSKSHIEPHRYHIPRRYWLIKKSIEAVDSTPKMERGGSTSAEPGDAIDDIGSDAPDYEITSGIRYSRDQKIRKAVKRRAGGKCEFCGEQGFSDTNNAPYLECHHIIALANDGADRMTNVIALCPKDHRQAHYGINREELEKHMIHKVESLQKKLVHKP
jgi:hypothetical protein